MISMYMYVQCNVEGRHLQHPCSRAVRSPPLQPSPPPHNVLPHSHAAPYIGIHGPVEVGQYANVIALPQALLYLMLLIRLEAVISQRTCAQGLFMRIISYL